ncbi:MAG TPA: hypothetical protein VEV16_02430 [Daejeonella sp.]|nr:hypothetical protein [Daejeonella sp.]
MNTRLKGIIFGQRGSLLSPVDCTDFKKDHTDCLSHDFFLMELSFVVANPFNCKSEIILII